MCVRRMVVMAFVGGNTRIASIVIVGQSPQPLTGLFVDSSCELQ